MYVKMYTILLGMVASHASPPLCCLMESLPSRAYRQENSLSLTRRIIYYLNLLYTLRWLMIKRTHESFISEIQTGKLSILNIYSFLYAASLQLPRHHCRWLNPTPTDGNIYHTLREASPARNHAIPKRLKPL